MPTLDPPDTMTMSASACRRRQDGVALVANQAGEVDDRAVTLGERGEHRSVGVGDLKVVRLSSRRAAARCR